MYDITELLKKGRIRTDIALVTTQSASPPKGFNWILIGGVLSHHTGNLSVLAVRTLESAETVVTILLDPNNLSFFHLISDHEPTGMMPIFSTVAEYYHAQFSPLPILDNHRVWFFGGALAAIHPIFLEWKR